MLCETYIYQLRLRILLVPSGLIIWILHEPKHPPEMTPFISNRNCDKARVRFQLPLFLFLHIVRYINVPNTPFYKHEYLFTLVGKYLYFS